MNFLQAGSSYIYIEYLPTRIPVFVKQFGDICEATVQGTRRCVQRSN